MNKPATIKIEGTHFDSEGRCYGWTIRLSFNGDVHTVGTLPTLEEAAARAQAYMDGIQGCLLNIEGFGDEHD